MGGLRSLVPAALCVPLMIAPTPSRACTVCDAERGREVREGIFGADFGANLLATALPFGFFLGITAAIHFGPPRSHRDEP